MAADDLETIRAEFTGYEDKLRALVRHLTDELENAPPSAVAGIAKVLKETMDKLEAVAPTRTDDVLDELAQARANRRTNAGI